MAARVYCVAVHRSPVLVHLGGIFAILSALTLRLTIMFRGQEYPAAEYVDNVKISQIRHGPKREERGCDCFNTEAQGERVDLGF